VCRYATLSIVYLFLYLGAVHLFSRGVPAMLAAFSLILERFGFGKSGGLTKPW
jgi:hypothetical protein